MAFQFKVCFVTEQNSPRPERWSLHFERRRWQSILKTATDLNVLKARSVQSECVVIFTDDRALQEMKIWLETNCTVLAFGDGLNSLDLHLYSDLHLFEFKADGSVQHVLLMPARCIDEEKDNLVMISAETVLNSVLSKRADCANLMLPRVDYINLDKRTDRKATFEASMSAAGVRTDNLCRFAAIEHKHGCIGCTQSHIAVLKQALQLQLPFVIVCEDDCVWKSHENKTQFVQQCRDFVCTYGEEWDVLILAASVHHFKSTATKVPHLHRVIDAQTTTAYVVNGQYIPKLLENFETSERQLREAIEERTRTGQRIGDAKRQYSLDIYWKKLQKEDRWFIFLPAHFRQQSDFSDIVKKKVSYSFV